MKNRISSLEHYHSEWKKSVEDPEQFWAEIASGFLWNKPWEKVLDWNFTEPSIRWFEGGQINITENCLDRHVELNGDKTAILWEPNHPDKEGRKLSYRQVLDEVCRASHLLVQNGVKRGDRVCIYLPMIPEALIAMLACARIGAIHSVVFAGFSAQSLAERIRDSDCRIVLTADGAYRGEKRISLKEVVDHALETCPMTERVIVIKHTSQEVKWTDKRDRWWHEEIINCPTWYAPEKMESEDPLFILYTSGSTGKPKGVMHTTAGYMIWSAYTFQNVFQYNRGDIYWCTADIGWITGHSYIVYGPLLSGATVLMFEGVPTWPDAGRFWQIIDKYQVSIFYTAPTAIRALMACGDHFVYPYSLASLKVLGTVGEPINEEAWEWYFDTIGKGKCPITDTWWQTETGGIMIAPLAGITPLKPSFATLPLPGVQPVLVNANGEVSGEGVAEGNLCIRYPWPGMLRSTWGDHERCRLTYFSTYPGLYFTGDGCKRDAEGNYRILGRVDDVINVSGHRLGTAEIESALTEHPHAVEAAVVGINHPIKGQAIYAFVICDQLPGDRNQRSQEMKEMVRHSIGPLAKPDHIQFCSGLPKTRSGKIMRRILRKIAEREYDSLGDISTLLDPAVVDQLRQGREELGE